MNRFKFRVHTNRCGVDYKKVIDWSKSQGSAYIVCLENSGLENEHCHGYIHFEGSVQTFRARMNKTSQKLFDGAACKGNKYYSIGGIVLEKEEIYPMKYFAYLVKKNEFVYEGIPEEVIEEAKQIDLLKKQEIKRTVLEQLEDYLQEDFKNVETKVVVGYNGPQTHVTDEYKKRIIGKVIMFYNERGSMYNMSKIESVVVTLLCRHSDVYKSLMIERISGRI